MVWDGTDRVCVRLTLTACVCMGFCDRRHTLLTLVGPPVCDFHKPPLPSLPTATPQRDAADGQQTLRHHQRGLGDRR